MVGMLKNNFKQIDEETKARISSTIGFKLNKDSIIVSGTNQTQRKSIEYNDLASKYSYNVGVNELRHNSYKVTENKLFIESVTEILHQILGKLNLSNSKTQIKNCVNVLDLLRRNKALAFVGPICSGKTTTLKIVSNVLHAAFKVKLRTSVVNTATMSPKDLYGSIDSFNHHQRLNQIDEKDAEGEFSKSGIFNIILDVFERERL